MTGDKTTLSSFQSTVSRSGVSTANGIRVAVVGQCTLHVDVNKEIKPILYVPGLMKNIMQPIRGMICFSLQLIALQSIRPISVTSIYMANVTHTPNCTEYFPSCIESTCNHFN